jgi:hypothetical protein
MEACTLQSRSIFDLIEERSATPETFGWVTDPAILAFTESEQLHAGPLLLCDFEAMQQQSRIYVLTLRALIKCKVKGREDG